VAPGQAVHEQTGQRRWAMAQAGAWLGGGGTSRQRGAASVSIRVRYSHQVNSWQIVQIGGAYTGLACILLQTFAIC
jgi:hypothetical protein